MNWHEPVEISLIDQGLEHLVFYLQPSVTGSYPETGQQVFNSQAFQLNGLPVEDFYFDPNEIEGSDYFTPYLFELKVAGRVDDEVYCETIGHVYGYLIETTYLCEDILDEYGGDSLFDFDDRTQFLSDFWAMIQESLLLNQASDPLYQQLQAELFEPESCFLMSSIGLKEEFQDERVLRVIMERVLPSFWLDHGEKPVSFFLYPTSEMGMEDYLGGQLSEEAFALTEKCLRAQGWVDLTHKPLPCLMKVNTERLHF